MARAIDIVADATPVLLRVNRRTGRVLGASAAARSYPPDLPAEERTFYLETDAARKAAYRKLLTGGRQSIDAADGSASVAEIAKLADDDKTRPDIVNKARLTAQAKLEKERRG